METKFISRELSIEQIHVNALSIEEYEYALSFHTYLMDWVLTTDNLDSHGKTMFLYACARGKIGEALSALMEEFGRPDSQIPPTEPPIWIEWATYWQRGFDPIANNRV